MLVDVAMDVLGLSGEPTPADVRRAYLRQVKAHPPERDPEGFRRVREAFELLQGGYVAPLVVARLAHAPAVEAPVAETEAETAPDSDEAPPSDLAAETSQALSGTLLPQATQEQVEHLKAALANDNPAAAAEAMTWLYQRPGLESAPVASPLLALQTVVALVQRGRFKPARTLLEALDHFVALNPQPGGFGPELGARWKLASELLGVSLLDSRLARALAAGLHEGDLSIAANAASAAFDDYGRELERHMLENAPTLWGQVAPLIRTQPQPVHPTNFRGSGWQGWVLVVVAINIFRLCVSAADSSPTTYSPPAPREEAPALSSSDVPPPEVPTLPAEETVQVPAALARELAQAAAPATTAAQRQFLAWALIEQSLRLGDCQTIRERWPDYVVMTRSAQQHVDPGRIRRILEMCPELQNLFEEPP
ncbi:MAG TPA: J domain-containing protein [Polyangiaceae bacterium]|nr:J domain-containing protein [Polyangiaceae bacterium]